MAVIPSFGTTLLERICKVLGDTSTGLTGSEIGKLLHGLGIAEPMPGMTKRVRLFEALRRRQEEDHCANLVLAFIKEAMNPVRYTDNHEHFNQKRRELNAVLAFAGYELAEDGRLHVCQAAKTLSEAEARADRLGAELRKRGVHHEVLQFCWAELLQENYFHAVLEATKSVAEKIRTKTGLKEDGAKLVDLAFGLGNSDMPLLAFNTLRTETEQSEHTGLMNLMKGVFGTFRNPTAHAPKISWNISEQDALDLLTMVFFLHRRLDSAVRTPRASWSLGDDMTRQREKGCEEAESRQILWRDACHGVPFTRVPRRRGWNRALPAVLGAFHRVPVTDSGRGENGG